MPMARPKARPGFLSIKTSLPHAFAMEAAEPESLSISMPFRAAGTSPK